MANPAARIIPLLPMTPESLAFSDVVALVALVAMCAMFMLYRRRAERARQAEELSLSDPLTGLRNRRFLDQVIGMDVATSLRHHRDAAIMGLPATDADLVFLLLDIDHFKSVNDEFGHGVGDHVLREIANVLRKIGRESDAVLRWGGEEFLIVARFTDRRLASATAERVRQAIEMHPLRLPNGGTVSVTCSIGFAVFPFEPARCEALSWEHVLTLADLATYDAKRNGRNRWVGYVSAGTIPAVDELRSVQHTTALVDGGRMIRMTSCATHAIEDPAEPPRLQLLEDPPALRAVQSR
ncbi:MAG TPA: GGDEF domain-containing protein [Gemmatimonadaceae bacterium]